MDLNTPIISKIIDNWIDEDIGRGDLTSPSITEENGNAYWIAKEEGIFCGVDIIKEIFKKIDSKISPKLAKISVFHTKKNISNKLLENGIKSELIDICLIKKLYLY